ncbi:hypothetical protein [Blastopirellula marina]|uniref:Uncharacterized protein n=1 Tax=Blastopirellula marina TaxID=124 RepID=A0A2S8FA41_9BACT|nr:hypothetical protein [Blastopirellula marina]PQO28980.1 hypothetical protein C5Y98_22470 [Blastopirellula marina]PTL42252.1 hypothetical protein C5Y97_22480 [Blastopirellula marina]
MERLTWLERDPFFAIVESRPPTVREWQYFLFKIDHDAIYWDIPVVYAESPDDESFPSAVRRWYGQIDDRLFVLDVFYDLFPHECNVQIPFSESDEFAWQTLLDLQLLPKSIYTNQAVFIQNDSESRIRTVFRRDPRGFDVPIYDGVSDIDAESLLDFLRPRDSTVTYSIGASEPDINWVTEELIGNSRTLRARYNSRTSAISVGCDMAQSSDNEFVVYSESPEVDARQFWIRNGRVTAVE